MIAVRVDKDHVQVSIPTEGMTPEEINRFVSWLRVESVLCRSRLTDEAAWKLSEEIKSDWWDQNKDQFTAPEGK